jgi:hypothetical protein
MQTNAPVRNQHNSRNFVKNGEVNNEPSLTVPDQALSIREILRRFSHGIPMDGQQIPIFDENENDLPDFRHMDLADREEAAEQFKQELASIKRRNTPKKAKNPSTAQGGTTEGGTTDGGSVSPSQGGTIS